MDRIAFAVPDLQHGEVRVIFVLDVNRRLSIFCTCRAALLRQLCDHRLRLLEGHTEGISSPDANAFERARSWVVGTEIERKLLALQAVRGASEPTVLRAQDRLARAMSR
jgi:hypothetical protein